MVLFVIYWCAIERKTYFIDAFWWFTIKMFGTFDLLIILSGNGNPPPYNRAFKLNGLINLLLIL